MIDDDAVFLFGSCSSFSSRAVFSVYLLASVPGDTSPSSASACGSRTEDASDAEARYRVSALLAYATVGEREARSRSIPEANQGSGG